MAEDEGAPGGQVGAPSASRAYCRTCRRLTVDALVEQFYQVTPEISRPIDVPEPAPLRAVDSFERRALLAIPVPAHPNSVVDDDLFRDLLASNTTLANHQKLDLLLALPSLSQARVDALLTILRADRKATERLNREHQDWIDAQEQRLRAALSDLDAKRSLLAFAPDEAPGERALTAADRAAILRKAIDPLLASLGPGAAQAIMTAVLSRLADRVEAGERGELIGLLPELFPDDLGASIAPKAKRTPAQDSLSSRIRPTLSRLRAARPEALVEYRGREYIVSLVLEGPGAHGPVLQVHRIALQVQPDYANTIDSYRYRHVFMPTFFRLVSLGPHDEVFPIERFGPFGRLITRAVELRGYELPGERRTLLLRAALALLERVLPILQFDERARFLATLLDVPMQPATQRSERFDDWFLRAIATPPDCDAEFEPFVRVVSTLDELLFHEKLAVIAHFRLLHPNTLERAVLMGDVRRAGEQRVLARELYVDAQPVALNEILQERVFHPDDFMKATEAHVASSLRYGFVPQTLRTGRRRLP